MKARIIRWVAVFAFGALALPQTGSAAAIAYWRFEPGSFTADSSGNGHTLVANGGVASSGDVPMLFSTGSALFDGVNDFMNTSLALDLSGETQLTIEWFMKNTGGPSRYPWGHGEAAGGGGMRTYLDNPSLGGLGTIAVEQDLSATAYMYKVAPLPGGISGAVWHHYAMEIDKTDHSTTGLKLYIDGVETGTFNIVGAASANFLNTAFHIGVRSGLFGYMPGYIDEFRISSGFLAPNEFLNAVPEPSSVALLVLGGLLLWRRGRK